MADDTEVEKVNFTRGPVYEELKSRVEDKSLLNIHFPGTGGRKNAPLPTRNPLSNLHDLDVAVLFLEGPATDGPVAPVMANTNTLEPQTVKPKSIFKQLGITSVAASRSEAEEVFSTNPIFALAGGVVTGAGKKNNSQIVINTLKALNEDKNLPKVVHLSGHSRGAIAAIFTANRIWEEFGDAIQIHLTLTDPVPGPGHNGTTLSACIS